MNRTLAHAAVALAVLAGGFAVACDRPVPEEPSPLGTGKVGDVHSDPGGWIEYTIGDAPLVISAPHGGALVPTFIPDRTCAECLTGADVGIEDLARRVGAQFFARTGRHPHMVINKLQRGKLDPNRSVEEATGGNAVTIPLWKAYHAFLDTANARVAAENHRGLLLDLHGHSHAIERIELGYLVTSGDLQRSDAALSASGAVARSGITRLASDNAGHLGAAALLRGPSSLGALLGQNGYPSVPSPSIPAPAPADEFYDGGYIVDHHGSSRGGPVDAVQIEAWKVGVRDTPENRERYAAAIVASVIEYLKLHYGWVPAVATSTGTSAR